VNRLAEAVQRKGEPVVAVAVMQKNTAFVEMAASVGFEVLWIEMEHAGVTFSEASDLCGLASAFGMLTLIRVPNAERQNVLRAAECGVGIIDVPMVNEAEVARELVRHARFSPEGERGHFGSSRALRYGFFEDIVAERERINREICLMAQIETPEAVERVEEIASVPGLDAIFIGRGDLSAAMGYPGQLNHPAVDQATVRCMAAAREHGKLIGVPGSPAEYGLWRSRGVHLFVCASDVGCMKTGLQAAMQPMRSQSQ
jgi:4-hydroxy-2-oxoheptanedioate aldolase